MRTNKNSNSCISPLPPIPLFLAAALVASVGSAACGGSGAGTDTGGVQGGSARCTPGEVTCTGSAISRCGADGKFTPVTECSHDPAFATCGQCADGPSCLAPKPLCAGHVTGLTRNPITWSESGCYDSDFTCETTVDGQRLIVTVASTSAPITLSFRVDLERALTEQSYRLELSGPITFSAAHWVAGNCHIRTTFSAFQTTEPTDGGTAVIHWSSTKPGAPAEIEMEGLITCDEQHLDWQPFRAALSFTF